MLTILITSDNRLVVTVPERIMQKSKLVDTMHLLTAVQYKGLDMSLFSATLEYILPVSREYRTESLVLSKDLYKGMLEYKLPFDTYLTKEAGQIELHVTFTFVDLDENGKSIQRVRKTSPTTITIHPVAIWSDFIPDNALSALDQRILKQDAQFKALADLANMFDNNQVDNLIYNTSEETLQLSAKGVGIGDKVSVRDMIDDGIPVVDLDSGSESKPDTEHNTGCNCGCEDNVVEFSGVDTPNKSVDDNYVVEF